MRRIQYDQFKRHILVNNRCMPSETTLRSMRTKPRDPQELDYLIQHALQRKEQALASREYEILATRRWRVNVPNDPN